MLIDGKMVDGTYSDLVDDIESICVSLVCEVNADQRIDNIIPVVRDTIERVAKIGTRILDAGAPAQHHKTRDDDEQEYDELDC